MGDWIKMNRKLTAIIATGLLLISAAGCENAKEVAKDALTDISAPAQMTNSSEAASENGQVSDMELNEAEVIKFNAYINVNNFMVDRLDLVINSYFNHVAYQEEFEVLGGDYWCNSLLSSNKEELEEAHQLAVKEPSFGPLDEAFEAMYPDLKAMMDALDEVYEYTDTKSYLDDDYAKAKELHAVIFSSYTKYEELGSKFMVELDIVANQRKQDDLKRLQEEGFYARYSAIKLLTTAQEIQSAIYEQGVYDENLLDLDIAAIDPLYQQLLKDIDECNKYMSDADQLAKEGFVTTGVSTRFFLDAMKEMKVALTETIQRVKEGKPLQSYEINTSFSASGSISNYDAKLGDLIDQYNNL